MTTDYLEDLENFAKNARNKHLESDDRVQLVVFRVEDRLYAFSGEAVAEIILPAEIFSVPGLPPFILGVMNLRGDVESVVDLRKLMNGTDCRPLPGRKILMARSAIYRAGILVEELVDVTEIPKKDIVPVSEAFQHSSDRFFVSEFRLNDEIVLLIDVNRVFEKVLVSK